MIAKKAALIVSFGTSSPDVIEKNIVPIENEIEHEFPEYKIYRAFTSRIILKKLEKNFPVDCVPSAMERMKKDGIREVIIQPTYIIPGVEFNYMLSLAAPYVDSFDSITTGLPLLYHSSDFRAVVDIISKDYYREDRGLILMGHGSDHFANAAYPALDYAFKKSGFKNVFIGTVEGEPDICDVIKLIGQTSLKKVDLLPLLIVAGEHASNDMAGDAPDSWKNILSKNGYEVNCILKGLGENLEIRRMFIRHMEESLPLKSFVPLF